MAGARITPDVGLPATPADRSGFAAALTAVAVWGLMPVAVRYFVTALDPQTFSAIRFAASVIVGLPIFVLLRPWRWPGRDLARLSLCAFLGVPALSIPLAFAAQTIPAGGLSLLSSTEPIFILLFSLLLTRYRIGARVFLGGGIALAGVTLAMSKDAGSIFDINNFGAVLLCLTGAASWGLYTVLAAPLAKRYGTYKLTTFTLVVGGALAVLATAPAVAPSSWPSPIVFAQIALVSTVISLLGFVLWNYGATMMTPHAIGILLYLTPVFGIIGGVTLLREAPTWQFVAGGFVILAGVAIGEGRI